MIPKQKNKKQLPRAGLITNLSEVQDQARHEHCIWAVLRPPWWRTPRAFTHETAFLILVHRGTDRPHTQKHVKHKKLQKNSRHWLEEDKEKKLAISIYTWEAPDSTVMD